MLNKPSSVKQKLPSTATGCLQVRATAPHHHPLTKRRQSCINTALFLFLRAFSKFYVALHVTFADAYTVAEQAPALPRACTALPGSQASDAPGTPATASPHASKAVTVAGHMILRQALSRLPFLMACSRSTLKVKCCYVCSSTVACIGSLFGVCRVLQGLTFAECYKA